MEEVHLRVFPGVPIVFCLPHIGGSGAPADSDFTGVENDLALAETLEVALRLRPGAEHAVVVGGVSDFDKQEQDNVKQELEGFTNRLDIYFCDGSGYARSAGASQHLPPHTLILLTSVARDAGGARFKSYDAGPLITAAANAPVFGLYDVYLNHGEVGGYLSSLSEQGKVAGGLALRLLGGAKPQDIPRGKWRKHLHVRLAGAKALGTKEK